MMLDGRDMLTSDQPTPRRQPEVLALSPPFLQRGDMLLRDRRALMYRGVVLRSVAGLTSP